MTIFLIAWVLVGIFFLVIDAIEFMQTGVDGWHGNAFNNNPIVYMTIRAYAVVLLWPFYAILVLLLWVSK